MFTRREVLAALLSAPAALKACLAGVLPSPAREKQPKKLQSCFSAGQMVFDGRSYTIHNHQVVRCREDQLINCDDQTIRSQTMVGSIETWKEPPRIPRTIRIAGLSQYLLFVPRLVGSEVDINYLVTRRHDLAEQRSNELLLPLQVRLKNAKLSSCGPAYLSRDGRTRVIEALTIKATAADVPWYPEDRTTRCSPPMFEYLPHVAKLHKQAAQQARS